MEITQVEPHGVRDRVLDLIWEHRHWPGSSREEYRRLWDWRFGALAEGDPLAWVARTKDGEVVGHVAVFPRRFRVGDTEIRCGLPGDILVHRAWRSRGVGARLVLTPKMLVKQDRFDMVMVVGNPLAHRLCLRLGYRDFGTHHRYVDLRRFAPVLRRRLRPAAALGPLADGLWSVRRWWRQRHARRSAGELSVERLDADAVAGLDRRHWSHPPGRVVPAENEAYLVKRFLADPFTRRGMFGLRDPGTGRIEGHVAVEYRGSGAVVCDCRVNASRLDEAAAIALVGDALPSGVASYAVPTLPGSLLSRELAAAGFLHRPPEAPADARLHISAFWSEDHPLARQLGRLERWSLYLGAADG